MVGSCRNIRNIWYVKDKNKVIVFKNIWNDKIKGERKMKKPKLDLSKENCHCCGNPLVRDMKNLTEKCIHYSCSARNVNFSIPFVDEGENTK